MERLLLECALRAALLVGGTAIVLSVMRVKPATGKHRVWTGVMLLMLTLPIWTAWGPKLPLRVLPAAAQSTANDAIVSTEFRGTTSLPSSLMSRRETILLGIYLLGLCALLIRLAAGTHRAHKLVRGSRPENGIRVTASCSVPVTVGFFHPVVILPEHWRRWSQSKLDAVLAHEGEHVRRRDSLVQWLALLNRAIFWFHPAAWWLERTLSSLAEQACDEVVLARGHNPGDYAGYLLDLARSVTHSGARLNLAGMRMPGTSLPKRIRKIMEGRPVVPISRARMACVIASCVITCAAFTTGTLARIHQSVTDQSSKTDHRFDGLQILTPHEGVDFDAFSAALLKTVKKNWYAKMPEQAQQDAKGKVTVRLGIRQDGTLSTGPTVDVSSGNKPLDDAAVSAIRASAPFEHLPEGFKGPNIELALTFFYNEAITDTATPADQSSPKLVLRELEIEGDVQDRDAARNRILQQFKDREYDDVPKLTDAVAEIGIREDFQDRGYFKVSANGTRFTLLGMEDGKRAVRVSVSVNEGEQYHFGGLSVSVLDPPLTVPKPEVIQGMFQMRGGDLFNVSELRKGMKELKRWYDAQGLPNAVETPEFNIDDANRLIHVTIRVTQAH